MNFLLALLICLSLSLRAHAEENPATEPEIVMEDTTEIDATAEMNADSEEITLDAFQKYEDNDENLDTELVEDIQKIYESNATADFKTREENYAHDYTLLQRGIYNCDYFDGRNLFTKEFLSTAGCVETKVVLQSELESEPQKIFLQIVDAETYEKYGSVALRASDNKSYSFSYNLKPGTYMIDYVIAEGDTEADFYIEPQILVVKTGDSPITSVKLNRQSQIIVDGQAITLEEIQARLAAAENDGNSHVDAISSVYDAGVTVSKTDVADIQLEENDESEITNGNSVLNIMYIVIASIITLAFCIIFWIIWKTRR